jgi:hypothetical protein
MPRIDIILTEKKKIAFKKACKLQHRSMREQGAILIDEFIINQNNLINPKWKDQSEITKL